MPRLTNLIGATRAKRMIYTGERVPAEQAYEWGILTEVAEDAEALDAMVASYAKKLNAQSPLALRTAKRVVNTSMNASVHVGLELEGHAYEKLRDSYDYTEGANAFFEKRKPVYKGK